MSVELQEKPVTKEQQAVVAYAPPKLKKYKRGLRLSGRSDGRRIKTQPPLNNFMPYIMKRRCDSTNYFKSTVDCGAAEKYVRQKRVEGLKGFGMLHFFIAAYVRIISQRPGINRFISGQRLYARRGIEVVLTVKKDYTVEAMETTVKICLDPSDTAEDIFRKLQYELSVAFKDGDTDSNEVDRLSRVFTRIPGVLLRLTVKGLEALDYYGLVPRSLTMASPFHGSLFIADLGSIMLPPLHHHLYHFGNMPMFLVLGGKKKVYELDKNGETVEKKMLDYTLSLDERIVDGFYFAGVLRLLHDIFKNPAQLDNPPETVVEDIR